MPTTSSGETVYADPDELEVYVQTSPESLGVSTNDTDNSGTGDWREYLEALQPKAKSRIDSYCERDFEDHPNATVALDGGDQVIFAPSPVRTVYAVRIDGETLPADGYHAKEGGSLIRTGRTWPEGYGNVEVDLDYGWRTPPDDVAEAEMKVVDHTVVGQAQKREGMVTQSDDFSLEVNIPVAWNREIRGMLEPHRKMGVFS